MFKISKTNAFILLILIVIFPLGEVFGRSAGKKYLLSYLYCDTGIYTRAGCSNPAYHLVKLAESSDDGATWSDMAGTSSIAMTGSVPDVVRRENTIYLFTLGSYRTYDTTTSTLGTQVRNFSVIDSTGAAINYYTTDTSPILYYDSATSSYKIVIFYLVNPMTNTGEPGACATSSACTVDFGSAMESGTDADGDLIFTEVSGPRATITVDPTSSYPFATDPDIFQGSGGTYYLYISRGSSGVQVLQSSTLGGTFTNVAGLTDGILVNGLGGVASGYYDGTNYWTFLSGTNSGTGDGVILRATHSSLSTELTSADFTSEISGSSLGLGASGVDISSPGIARNTRHSTR